MRLLRLILVAVALTPLVGCESMKKALGIGAYNTGNNTGKDKGNNGALPPVTADQLVGYLNAQAARLQTLHYDEASVSAREGDRLLSYPSLSGKLTASQPRNFRMVVKGTLAGKVDFGSNPEQFWVYFEVPTVQPTYVFASHADFEAGKAKLPGNIPFESDWVMQALGMTTFPPNPQYTARNDDRERTFVLSWPAVAPNGMKIRKEVVFAADDADASRNQPQVKKHLIRDANGKLIASAEVKSAKTLPVGGIDPESKRPNVIQYPTEVFLRYEEQKFEMTLRLDRAKVNQPMTDDIRALFKMPTVGNTPPQNLANARFDTPGK